MRAILMAIAGATMAVSAPPALAQQSEAAAEDSALEQRAGDVAAWLAGDAEPEEIFEPSFLAAVPPAALATMNAQLESQFGAILGVEKVEPLGPHQARISLRFERAIGSGMMALSPTAPNRIAGLQLSSFEPIDDGPDKILADLRALPGESNALFARIAEDGSLDTIFAHDPGKQLALGSAFKLYVLSALAKSVADGERSWNDVVTLTEKSFPSGRLQDWPQGAPLTLQTLASMMISISDNTGTDQLIAVLGRDAVEAELVASGNSDPSRTIPFLTTRQLFAMRGVSDEFIARYRAADDDEQRAIIDALTEDDVSPERVQATFATETPGAIDIEWFASPIDLAKLLHRIDSSGETAALDVMAINPSMSEAQRSEWAYVGFKGGSEPGVLNLTWLLKDEQGEAYIVTLGWNNPEAAVETTTLELLAQRILSLPR